MSNLITALFARRADLMQEVARLDSMIMAEGQNLIATGAKNPSDPETIPSDGDPGTSEVWGLPTEPNLTLSQFGVSATVQQRVGLPNGRTMKATVIQVLQQAPESGYTIREIKNYINETYGAGTAKNIDQIIFLLSKSGQAKAHGQEGMRNRYVLSTK